MKNLLKNHIFLSLFTFIITFSSIMPTNKTKDSLKDLIDFYSMTTKKDVLALTPYFKKASEIPLFSSMTDKEKKEWDDIATQIKNYSTKLQNIDKEIKKIFATTDNEINKLRNNKTKILKKLSPEYKELQEKIDLINKRSSREVYYNLCKERRKIVSKIETNPKYKKQILPIEAQILKLEKQRSNLWSQPNLTLVEKKVTTIDNKINKLRNNKTEILKKLSPEYKELQEKIDLINKIQDEVYNLYKERQKIVSKIKTNQKYKEQILPIETQILKLKKQSDNLWSQPSFINLQKQHSSIKNKIRKLTMNKLLEIFRKMKTK